MTAKKRTGLRPRVRVWIERDGEHVFGDGRMQWLEVIEETGSLRAAAEAVGMSYRGLWGRLRATERRLGEALVRRKAGGRSGGGTVLTPAGRRWLMCYRRFRAGLDRLVERHFQKTFRA